MSKIKTIISVLIILAGLGRIAVWNHDLNDEENLAKLYLSLDPEVTRQIEGNSQNYYDQKKAKDNPTAYLNIRRMGAENDYRHILYEGLITSAFGLLIGFIPIIEKNKGDKPLKS